MSATPKPDAKPTTAKTVETPKAKTVVKPDAQKALKPVTVSHKQEGAIVVYVALHKNDDVKMEVPGEGRVVSRPGGWRIGLWSERGEGMMYYKYKIEDDTLTSETLAARAYALLKAVEFAHDKDVSARKILVRADFPNVWNVVNNRAHQSSQFIYVGNRHLQNWSVDGVPVGLQIEEVERADNKAVPVVRTPNQPSYYTQEAKAGFSASKQQAQQSATPTSYAARTPGELFNAAMSASELRKQIEDVEIALEMGRAMLAVKERREGIPSDSGVAAAAEATTPESTPKRSYSLGKRGR